MKVLSKLFSKKAPPAPSPIEDHSSVRPIEMSISAPLSNGEVLLGNAQHQGKRHYQEDSFGFSDITGTKSIENGVFAVIADGMGGLKNGKAVSESTVSALLEWFDRKPSTDTTGTDLLEITTEINRRICDIYCKSGRIQAGSTVVEAVIKNGYLHWLCIGDSRIYIKRGTRLYQVNEDHDYLNQLLGDAIHNNTDVRKAFDDPQKDSLVGCIGNSSLENFDYSKKGYLLSKGDIIILCSDGVYNALSESEFANNITESAMSSCRNIINLISEKNIRGQDNNTIITMVYR